MGHLDPAAQHLTTQQRSEVERANKPPLRKATAPGLGPLRAPVAHSGPLQPSLAPRQPSPVVPQHEVGVAHSVIHAAADELPRLVHSHPGHLIRVAFSREGVVFPRL